jgi:hypothetical protein
LAVPFVAFYPRSATLWVLTVGGLQMHDVIPNDVVPDYGQRQLVFHSTTLLAILWDCWARTHRSFSPAAGADVR